LLEAGLGEGTAMSQVLHHYGASDVNAYGFDLCWSRVYRARQWLSRQGLPEVSLCTASLAGIPFADNSFDVVYTIQSVEPNGGRETEILAELYRVASRYLVLLEPAFELANAEAQARMIQHGYCRDLIGHAQRLGMKVLECKLFPFVQNPLNPTALIVIEKDPGRSPVTPKLRCPKYQTPLLRHDQVYYSPDSFTIYPIIAEIPCLRAENAIIATLYSAEIATGASSAPSPLGGRAPPRGARVNPSSNAAVDFADD
jgi:hypothetical protein